MADYCALCCNVVSARSYERRWMVWGWKEFSVRLICRKCARVKAPQFQSFETQAEAELELLRMQL